MSMAEYAIIDMGQKTDNILQILEDMKDILSKMLETNDQIVELLEDIVNRTTDR